MGDEVKPAPPELRAALIEVMTAPRRLRVLMAVSERPGVTLKQIASRIGESPRSVRYQLKRLSDAGLVIVDAVTPRRNVRELHYRATVQVILEEDGKVWPEVDGKKVMETSMSLMFADYRRALSGDTFGRDGHAVVRIPGEVDDRGWQELSRIALETMRNVEEVMKASVARLRANGEVGTEAMFHTMFFETLPWEAAEEAPDRLPRTLWWNGDLPSGS